MIPSYDEDQLAKLLSELPPMEYDSLMKKVKRSKWNIMGMRNFNVKEKTNKKKYG